VAWSSQVARESTAVRASVNSTSSAFLSRSCISSYFLASFIVLILFRTHAPSPSPTSLSPPPLCIQFSRPKARHSCVPRCILSLQLLEEVVSRIWSAFSEDPLRTFDLPYSLFIVFASSSISMVWICYPQHRKCSCKYSPFQLSSPGSASIPRNRRSCRVRRLASYSSHPRLPALVLLFFSPSSLSLLFFTAYAFP
jgi:hypothetical protein